MNIYGSVNSREKERQRERARERESVKRFSLPYALALVPRGALFPTKKFCEILSRGRARANEETSRAQRRGFLACIHNNLKICWRKGPMRAQCAPCTIKSKSLLCSGARSSLSTHPAYCLRFFGWSLSGRSDVLYFEIYDSVQIHQEA